MTTNHLHLPESQFRVGSQYARGFAEYVEIDAGDKIALLELPNVIGTPDDAMGRMPAQIGSDEAFGDG